MRAWCIRLLVVLAALGCVGFEWEGRLSRLRRELAHPDAARRREVVIQLASYPPSEVREALLGALEDPDAGVRAEAAEAVGRVRLAEAVPRLVDWLDDPETDVRAAAARALGRIGAATALPSLVRALGDAHPDVRRAAVEAVASLGSGEGVVPLLGRLDDEDPRVRVDTASVLGRLGDPRAVVPLVGRARDDAPEVRAAVYTALGDLGEDRAVPALVQGLRDETAESQLAAVGALGRLGSEMGVRPLMSLLDASDARLPRAAVAALGRIDAPAARAALVEALAHPTTRVIAGGALVERARRGARGAPDGEASAVVAALSEALDQSTDAAHVTEIARGLAAIAERHDIGVATPAILRALREGRGDAPPVLLRALGATGSPDALLPLLEGLAADDVAQRLAVLEGLARYVDRAGPDGRAADPLLAALGRVSAPERAPLVALLGRMGAARALPTLRTLLTHPDADLRLASVRAIGAIGDPGGAPALTALLDDPDPRLRFEAAQALGSAASPEQIAPLLDRLRQRAPTDRHALLAALAGALPRLHAAGTLPAPVAARAREQLLALAAAEDEPLAAAALDVLAAIPMDAVAPELAARLARAAPRRRLSLLATLGLLDHDAARAALLSALEDPSVAVRTQAASRLGEIAGPSEARALRTAAPALPWPASAAAAFSLARLARRGVLDRDESHAELCALGASHDPLVRANVAVAFAALASPPCPSGADAVAWLEPHHADVVRGAAARWARRAADAGHVPAPVVDRALAECARDALAPDLAATCARPELPPLGELAEVTAFDGSGRRRLAGELVALRLADGAVWVTRADENGHLRLPNAPRGPLYLEDPAASPLEP